MSEFINQNINIYHANYQSLHIIIEYQMNCQSEYQSFYIRRSYLLPDDWILGWTSHFHVILNFSGSHSLLTKLPSKFHLLQWCNRSVWEEYLWFKIGTEQDRKKKHPWLSTWNGFYSSFITWRTALIKFQILQWKRTYMFLIICFIPIYCFW